MWKVCGAFFAVAAVQMALVYAAQPFSWTDCTPAESPIKIASINVEPSPVVVPGDLFVSVNAASTRQLSHTKLQLAIKRKTFLGLELTIPCLFNVGSCTYDDVCTLVTDMETQNWAGSSANIGHTIRALLTGVGINVDQCPQPVTQLSLNHAKITIGEIPSVLSFLAAGDYHIHVTATDTASSQVIVCLDLQVSMHEKCSGLGCLIG